MALVQLTVPASKPLASRAVERAGLRIMQTDGVWYGDEGAQAIIDAHDALAEAMAERLIDLDAESERRMSRYAAASVQSDLSLRLVRYLCIRAGVGTTARQLTADEQTDATQIVARLQRMVGIRQARRQIETRLSGLTDVWTLLGVNVATAPEWPAEGP